MKENGSDVIIFSRNRPWQLQQLLKSIKDFTDFRKINVIFNYDNDYLHNYRSVIGQFSKYVNFIEDGSSILNSFIHAFTHCSNGLSFMADDLVFFDKFSSADALDFINKNNIFSYHFKLNKKYDYCHSVSKKQYIPKNMEKKDSSWIWKENDGTWDWYYPFDLTGSMYVKKDIKSIVSMMHSNPAYKKRIKSPNDIEMIGSEYLFAKGMEVTGKTEMACPDSRCCACISLNHTNKFSFSPANPSEKCTLQYINENVFGRYDYDRDYFLNLDQRSCHITDYKLKPI